MASERQNMSDQEISIKARQSELYTPATVDHTRQVKPFPVYLRETPAEPLSTATKAILWIVGIIVATLFFAALWRVSRGHLARPAVKKSPPARKVAFVRSPTVSLRLS
jgi:hypothetical protein